MASVRNDSEFLKKRVDYLEEVNRQFLYAIDVVKAFGELQRKIGAEYDPLVIQKESAKLFAELINFDACAFFMLSEDMLDFTAEYVQPAEAKEELISEINEQIEMGTFSWALNQQNVNIVPSINLPSKRKILLHPLATESRVIGMFVVVLNEETSHFLPETLALLSLALISISLALENAALYQDLYDHSINLDKKVKERTAEIRKLLGMAAHDLRNPLAAVRGFAELLNDGVVGDLNDDQKELTGSIYTTTHSLLALVNDLLDISVIESGEMNLTVKPGNLVELAREVIRLDQLTADRKGISIKFETHGPSESMSFDYNKMRQVVDNLISNAIKFSPHGSTIRVSAETEHGQVKIAVKDEGPGIPENERELVFKTFGKASVKPTGGETSTGLGLAICHRIIHAHGGNITIECPDSGGSEFAILLDTNRLENLALKN